MRTLCMLFGLAILMTGCYQINSNRDDDLRAVPVTNNPNIVPDRGLGPMRSMPY